MRQLKYMKQLEPFLNVPFFTAADAEKQNVPRHALAYLVKRGILERIYPGLSAFPNMNQKLRFSGKIWRWSQLVFPIASFV